jgi:hypothetical protein
LPATGVTDPWSRQQGTTKHSPNTYQPEENPIPRHHPPPYSTYLSNQQKMVARGPKIHFPEFDGTDPEGWIGNQRSILK